jgi:hypothetical protein
MWRQLGSEVLKNFLTSLAYVKGYDKEVTAYLCWCQHATCYPDRLMTINYIRLAGLAPLLKSSSRLSSARNAGQGRTSITFTLMYVVATSRPLWGRVGDMYPSSPFQIIPSHLSARLHGSQLLEGTA